MVGRTAQNPITSLIWILLTSRVLFSLLFPVPYPQIPSQQMTLRALMFRETHLHMLSELQLQPGNEPYSILRY